MKEAQDRNGGQQQPDESGNRLHGSGTPLYLNSNSTLQSPEEHAHDKSVDPRQDQQMEASSDDLHEIKAGKLTGRETETDLEE